MTSLNGFIRPQHTSVSINTPLAAPLARAGLISKLKQRYAGGFPWMLNYDVHIQSELGIPQNFGTVFLRYSEHASCVGTKVAAIEWAGTCGNVLRLRLIRGFGPLVIYSWG